MLKSKVFFIIAVLAITMIGCLQVEEATFIKGEITKINKESAEIEVESWSTVNDAESSTESYVFKEMPDIQTIRISNPERFDGGQKVQGKVIKNYKEDGWDIDRLKFEVERAILTINLWVTLVESPKELSKSSLP